MGHWFSPPLARWFVAWKLRNRSFTDEEVMMRVYVDDFGLKSSSQETLDGAKREVEGLLRPLEIEWSGSRKIMDVAFAGGHRREDKFDPKQPLRLKGDVEIPRGVYEACVRDEFARVNDRMNYNSDESTRMNAGAHMMRMFRGPMMRDMTFLNHLGVKGDMKPFGCRKAMDLVTGIPRTKSVIEKRIIKLTWAPCLMFYKARRVVRKYMKMARVDGDPTIWWKCDNVKGGMIVTIKDNCIEMLNSTDDGTVVGSERTFM
jgi:hypothetical protein